MKIVDAFATPLTKVRCPEADNINPELHSIILELSQSEPSDDEGRAHVGGWYSRNALLQHESSAVRTLRSFVAASLRQYMAEVVSPVFAKEAGLRVAAWAALTRQGEYQTPHVHAGTHLSGVYYVKTPQRPRPEGALALITPVGEQEMEFFSSISATAHLVHPESGDLVIFPSYVRHYTHPFRGPEDRTVVVFTARVV